MKLNKNVLKTGSLKNIDIVPSFPVMLTTFDEIYTGRIWHYRSFNCSLSGVSYAIASTGFEKVHKKQERRVFEKLTDRD